jgi:iron complex transport system ATP-binding protein
MGKNGIGKSCLLKTIVGLLSLKAGEIFLHGNNISKFSPLELSKTISVVLTEKVHVEFLKVSELIALGRSPYLNSRGVINNEDLKIIKDIVRLLKIESLENFFFQDLSDGQKQKVLIARALAQNPKILILDEPTTFLDIQSRTDLMLSLKNVAIEKNISILLSSHDADLATKFADRVWHINSDQQLKDIAIADLKNIFS